MIINNETSKSINQATDEFEEQRKLYEIQKKDDSKQIENLEVEIDDLKKDIINKDGSIAHLKKNLTITLSDTDRFKNEVEKLKTENSKLIKEL